MGSNRQAGDSDSNDEDAQPVQLSRKRQKANRYAPHAEKLRAAAEVKAVEVEAAVASLRGAIVAFKAAEDEGFDEKGGDRRGLRGTCAERSVQQIRHQRAALLERGGKFKFALISTPIKGRSLVSLFF